MTLPVTVVIPVYNRARELRRALETVFAQTPDLADEVIVVDDGSSDETAAVAAAMGARVVVHEQNRGLAAARNTGLQEARNEWVALLDSDDEWCPHHLATLWPLRADHVLVATSAMWCRESSSNDRFQGPVERRPIVLDSPRTLLYPGNFITVSAAMVKRSESQEVGGFVAHHGVAEDLHAWCRLLEVGTAHVSPVVTIRYAVHEGQMSSDYRTMHRGKLDIAQSYAGHPWWSTRLVERWKGVAAWDAFRAKMAVGDRRRALRELTLLARPQPALGLLGILARRFRVRRRSAMWTRDGALSTLAQATGRSGSAGLRPRDWLKVARRPPGRAVLPHGLPATALRALGTEVVQKPTTAGRAPDR